MKKQLMFVALLAMGLSLGSSAWAHEGMDCDSGKCSMGSKHGKMEKGGQCPIAAKVEKKADFLMDHKSDLALTGDQIKKIQEIDLATEKASAQQGADMKAFMLDLKSKLGEESIDVAGTDALIDKNTALFAAAAKANVDAEQPAQGRVDTVVDAYASLQKVLTPEQTAKVKDLWKEKKENWKKEKHHE